MKLAALAATACVAALLAGVAHAQPREVEELVVTAGSQVDLPSAYAGGQVARGGRVGLLGALDVMDTPFSAVSYTEALIRNQQARSIADVLQNDPTVRVAKGFGNFQELYVVRGFPVYSDDITYNGVYGVLPRQYVAAELFERVDVLRGANSFLNGAAPGGSGVAGAFNLTPKRAPNGPVNRVTVGVETGGQALAAGDFARRFADDSLGVRANLVRRAGETAIDGQKRRLTALGLGADYRGERLKVSADVGYQDHRIDAPRPSVTPTGAVPRPPQADTNFAQPWTYTDERDLFGAVRGEFALSDRIAAWAAVGGRDGKEGNRLANPNAGAAGVTSAYRFDNARRDKVVSADAGLRADLDTGPVSHRLVGSVSAIASKSRNAYAFSDFAGFAGSLYAPAAVSVPAANFFIGGVLSDPRVTERVDNKSFAVADMLSFLDGKVLATVGLRRQSIETRTYEYNTGLRGSRYKASATTPAFALVYKPAATVSLYANYAEALTPGQIAPAVSGSTTISNAGEVLAPFRAKQYEAGVKYDAGAFGGTLSAFTITQASAIVQGSRFTAGGEQRHRGLELSAYGEPVSGLRLLGGATLLDAERRRTGLAATDGLDPIGVPKRQGNINVEWDVPAVTGLTLDGRLVYTATQKVDAANTYTLGSWTRLDLGVRYLLQAAGRDITLRARVENVADKNYWASVGGYPGANYLVLGSPRTFALSASVEF